MQRKKKTGEVTQLPEVITFPLFISLFTCGCVQAELIEIPERKHFNGNPITSRPGLLAGLVNMYMCAQPPTNNITGASYFFVTEPLS